MSRINRINYIVEENPKGVSSVLLADGINPSSNIDVLIKQTKGWIQKRGQAAIIKLLQVHPEKNAILSANQSKFENFGGCPCKSSFDGSSCKCSSFDGSACSCSKSSYSEELGELEKMDKKELKKHYNELKRLLKRFPEDKELREEVETVWQHLKSKKQRKNSTRAKKQPIQSTGNNSKAVFSVTSKDLAVGSFILGIALIISQIR